MGLAQGTGIGLDWTDLAAIVRFSSGVIDAHDGGTYAALTSIPYSIGLTYRVREDLDVNNHTYSIPGLRGGLAP